MDVFQLRAVVEVVKTGSFTKAAENLFSSPQTVKNQIDALEIELGCRLFLRSPKGTLATAEGKYLCEKSEQIIDDLEKMALGVRAFGVDEGIAIACPRGSDQPIRDSICTDFIALYPDITLRYVVCNEEESVVDCVLSGRANVSFINTAMEDREPVDGFVLHVCHSIPAIEHYAVMLDNNPLTSLERITAQDLAQKTTVLAHKGSYLPKEFESLISRQDLLRDTYEIVNYCLDGGIFIDDNYMSIVHKGLVRVPLDLPPMMMGVISRVDSSSSVEAFVRHCVDWSPNGREV